MQCLGGGCAADMEEKPPLPSIAQRYCGLARFRVVTQQRPGNAFRLFVQSVACRCRQIPAQRNERALFELVDDQHSRGTAFKLCMPELGTQFSLGAATVGTDPRHVEHRHRRAEQISI